MLEGKTKNVASFSGDGAYDDFCFRELLGNDIDQIIPPPKTLLYILKQITILKKHI
ncbi:MAG: hypothetical protein Ta2A_11760 [Treponemataceae bacterium]|nr:MAG: hypothetical protein Ta2A_11760 [Treponemataceae bacterium]